MKQQEAFYLPNIVTSLIKRGELLEDDFTWDIVSLDIFF